MRLSDKFRQLAATTQVKVKSLIEVSIANARSMRASRVIPFTGLFFAVCAVGAVGVAPLAPDASNLPVKTVTQDLVLPSLDEQISKIVLQQQHYVKEEKIQRGDTLASLLQRLGVDDVNATNFLKSDPVARGVLQARAGKSIRVKTTDEGTLEWLRVGLDGNENGAKTLLVSRHEQNGFQASEVSEQLERRIEMRSGDIQSSLFVATDKALIPAAIADQIVKMFETSIDFRRLQRGDYFNVVYETFWLNGELVKTGRLLSGEFKNSGKLSQAVWFDEGAGEGGYYSFDGKSFEKSFLEIATRILSCFLRVFLCVCIQFLANGSVTQELILPQRLGHQYVHPLMAPLITLVRKVVTAIWSSLSIGTVTVPRTLI